MDTRLSRPPVAPNHFASFRRDSSLRPHASVTSLPSALTNLYHSQELKIEQNQHLRKNRGWVSVPLTSFPKRNWSSATLPTQLDIPSIHIYPPSLNIFGGRPSALDPKLQPRRPLAALHPPRRHSRFDTSQRPR